MRYVSCHIRTQSVFVFFFFNDTATTEIYTLSLHDALPISQGARPLPRPPDAHLGLAVPRGRRLRRHPLLRARLRARSEEHTSELQSRRDLVCRLLLEKKKKYTHKPIELAQSHLIAHHTICT